MRLTHLGLTSFGGSVGLVRGSPCCHSNGRSPSVLLVSQQKLGADERGTGPTEQHLLLN
jgi:hypothetical protein